MRAFYMQYVESSTESFVSAARKMALFMNNICTLCSVLRVNDFTIALSGCQRKTGERERDREGRGGRQREGKAEREKASMCEKNRPVAESSVGKTKEHPHKHA